MVRDKNDVKLTSEDIVREFLECPFDSTGRDALWADDGVFEIPYSTRGRIVVRGRAEIARRMDLLGEVMEVPVFRNVKIYATADPEVFFTVSTFQARIRATGKLYEDEFVQIFHVRDGRVHRRIEYFNPLAMQAALDGRPLVLAGDRGT